MGSESHKLITAVVPQGGGLALLKQLYEKQVLTAVFSTARAPFSVARRKGGITRIENYSVEKDVVEAVVPEERADEIFAFIHEAAGIGSAHGGFMFQGPVLRPSAFVLPQDLPRS
jgi:hypothetical protein